MDYEIKRGEEVVVKDTPIGGGLVKKVMAEHLVNFSLELPEPVDFKINDYIEVYKERFELNRLPGVNKSDSSGPLVYEYTFSFEALFYRLTKIIVKGPDATNHLKKVNHVLTGTADAHIDLILRNANLSQSGWTKGTVEKTNTFQIVYNGQNCLAVLSELAQLSGLEWWVDGQVIYLGKRAKTSRLKFEYGLGKGLYELIRTNLDSSNVVTRLYVEGGTKNLPGDYRNYSDRLQLPEATGGYLEKNVDLFGVIEHALTFDEIFPNRVGTVTSVKDAFTFTDTGIDFNVNDYLLPEPAKIVFNTGQLAGYELEIASFDNITKTFVLNKNEDEKHLEIPSVKFHAVSGDRYIIIGIKMPQKYIDLSEAELQAKGDEYKNKNCVPRTMYAVKPDRIHFRRNGIKLTLGDYVKVADSPMGIDVDPRIIAYEQDLHDEFNYTRVELSENVQIPAIVRQYAEQDRVNRIITVNKTGGLLIGGLTGLIKTTPTKYNIVLNEYFAIDPTQDKPLYWKENNVVKFSGDIIQPTALDLGQRRGAERSAFNLPVGFRPKTEIKTTVTVKTATYNGIGSMRITIGGDAFINAVSTVGEPIRESLIHMIDLSGANFSIL